MITEVCEGCKMCYGISLCVLCAFRMGRKLKVQPRLSVLLAGSGKMPGALTSIGPWMKEVRFSLPWLLNTL